MEGIAIVLSLIGIAVVIFAPRIQVWWLSRKIKPDPPKLSGSMHSRYPECGNRATRRASEFNHRPQHDVVGYGKTDGAEHYDPSGNTPYIR